MTKDSQSINAIASDNKKNEISKVTPEKMRKRKVVNAIWTATNDKILQIAEILGLQL